MLNALIGSGAGAGAGAAALGPVGGVIGALGVPIGGHIAQRLATRMTRKQADLARAMAAHGTTPDRMMTSANDRSRRLAEAMMGR